MYSAANENQKPPYDEKAVAPKVYIVSVQDAGWGARSGGRSCTHVTASPLFHSSDELDETTVAQRHTEHDVRVTDVSYLHVVHGQDKGRRGEAVVSTLILYAPSPHSPEETQRGRVGEASVVDRESGLRVVDRVTARGDLTVNFPFWLDDTLVRGLGLHLGDGFVYHHGVVVDASVRGEKRHARIWRRDHLCPGSLQYRRWHRTQLHSRTGRCCLEVA